jgi:cyclopropane-fatty-acyl-phospholipid synthase
MPATETTISIKQPSHATPGWQHRLVTRIFAPVRYGRLTVHLNDGSEVRIRGSESGPSADIKFRSILRSLLNLGVKGDIGFAESYMAGHWDSSDLPRLMYFLSLNLEALGHLRKRSWAHNMFAGLQHRLNRNTLNGSKKNIAAHYDLGNKFYARWLDTSMTYSSALFDQSQDLDHAQNRKYERIFEKLGARPGDHILEVGCGWGGFAEYAAKRGCKVSGITLSQEQLEYATERMKRNKLEHLVNLEIRDYRNLSEQYDHIVSIEMIEAVGREYWDSYFFTLKRCLKAGGNIVIQSIVIDESLFPEYENNPGGFIQRYIFPGGMLPTTSHLKSYAMKHYLETLDIMAFGQDYATTLATWHDRFNSEQTWLEQNRYDEYFRRMWQYYLSFCEAGFLDGRTDVVQIHYRHLD